MRHCQWMIPAACCDESLSVDGSTSVPNSETGVGPAVSVGTEALMLTWVGAGLSGVAVRSAAVSAGPRAGS